MPQLDQPQGRGSAPLAQRSLAGTSQVMAFPPELKRGLFDGVDRRFLKILLLCLLFVYGGMILLVATYHPLTELDVMNEAAIQRILDDTVTVSFDEQTFAQNTPPVAEAPTAPTPPVAATPEERPAPTPAGGGNRTPRAQGGGDRREEGGRGERAVDQARSQYQAQVNNQVNNSGLFADLTARDRTSGRGGPGAGAGRGATDILGGAAGGEGNLSNIVSGSTGAGGGGGAGIGIGNGRGRGDGTGVGRGSGSGTGVDARGSGSGLGSGSGIGPGSGGGRQGSVAAKARRQGTGSKSGSSTRDLSAIERYIASQDAAIRACYANAKQADPSLSGSVTVGFRIKPDGRTVAVRVANSSLRSDVVERCMQNKMRGWNFPAAPAGDTEDLIIGDLEYVFSD